MPKSASQTRSTVIRCPNCGEDYSITYRRCPFCDEKNDGSSRRAQAAGDTVDLREDPDYDLDDFEEDEPRRRGGKRLASSGGGGDWNPLRIIGTVVCLAIIIAAIWVVVTQIIPLITGKQTPPSTIPSAEPSAAATVIPSAAPSDSPSALPSQGVTGAPVVGGTSPAPSQSPTAAPSQTPASSGPTGFTLNRSDFTLNGPGDRWTLKATFTPSGTSAFVSWKSENTDVATVNEAGTVVAVAKGTTNIVATMDGGYSQKCIVRVTDKSTGDAAASSAAPAADTDPVLNKVDFTCYSAGEKVQMSVSGASGTPSWSIGNTSVATVSESGLVTAVGPGDTQLTCTVDGKTLTCMVRCRF